MSIFLLENCSDYLWCKRIVSVSVLRPEVDNTGYDIVLSHDAVVRHVQLKCSKAGAKASSQNINARLSSQPSGCVIWIVLGEQLEFSGFRWFGDHPGKPLPGISGLGTAKHTKGNSMGEKKERPGIRKIPKGVFTEVRDMSALVEMLFGSTLEVAE